MQGHAFIKMISKLKRKIRTLRQRLTHNKRRARISHFAKLSNFKMAEKYIRLNSIENEYNFNSEIELSSNLAKQGRHSEAEKILNRIIKAHENSPDDNNYRWYDWKARMQLAQFEYERFRINGAITHLKSIKSFSGFNDYFLTHEMLARMHKYHGNHEDEFSVYNAILERNYRHIERIYEPYFHVADKLFPNHAPEEILKKHHNLESEYFSSIALAKYYLTISDLEKARLHIEEVATAYPGYQKFLGEIYLQQGHLDKARNCFYQEWKRTPMNVRSMADLFWVIIGGVDNKATDLMLRAIAKIPQVRKRPTIYKRLAMFSGSVQLVLDSYQGTAATNALAQSLPEKYQSSLTQKVADASSLLVLPLWGIGDEVIFASAYHDLEKFSKLNSISLTIGTEHRLTGLMQRSFPNINFVTINRKHRGPQPSMVSEDEASRNEVLPDHNLYYSLDYSTWKNLEKYETIISAPIAARDLRKSTSDFENSKSDYLTPNPTIVKQLKERLDGISKKPMVGISWRSGIGSQERSLHYTKISEWEEIFKLSPHVDFVNLQYDNCDEELEYVKSKFGVEVINLSGIDLYNDLESVCALISIMDMTIAPCTVMGDFSGALGVKTLYFVNSLEGKWRFHHNLNDIWFKSIQFVKPDEYGDKVSLLKNTATEIKKHFSID